MLVCGVYVGVGWCSKGCISKTGQGQQVWREWLLAPVKVLTVAIDEEREIGNGQCSTAQCGECGAGCYKLFSFLQISGGSAAGEG